MFDIRLAIKLTALNSMPMMVSYNNSYCAPYYCNSQGNRGGVHCTTTALIVVCVVAGRHLSWGSRDGVVE